MAARLWLLVIAAVAASAALCAKLIGATLHWTATSCGAAAVLAFVLLPSICVAVLLLWSGMREERRLSYPLLRAALREPLYCWVSVWRIIVEPCRRGADSAALKEGPSARPLLLLHGILCNGGVWRGWLRSLRAAGFAPIRAVSLEPLLTSIDAHAARVVAELTALQRESRGARVAILAHSMGGLVARAALLDAGPQRVGQIVTLACPHHGTRLATYAPCAPAREMRPGSAWLAALTAREAHHELVPITSIYSLEDNVVLPARSARWKRARCHPLHGLGHLGLLASRTARRYALAALQAGDP